jgi:hypothetical protein
MDRRELTTSLGFFNFAGSYRAAAAKLRVCKLRAEHPHSPILFAYYHSIELYLKAFLRGHGVSAGFLDDHVKHDVKKLCKLCVKRGLRLDDGDQGRAYSDCNARRGHQREILASWSPPVSSTQRLVACLSKTSPNGGCRVVRSRSSHPAPASRCTREGLNRPRSGSGRFVSGAIVAYGVLEGQARRRHYGGHP